MVFMPISAQNNTVQSAIKVMADGGGTDTLRQPPIQHPPERNSH